MKKIFSIIMGLVAMTSLQAANTEVARLTLTGNGGSEASYITVRLDPEVDAAETEALFENTDLDGNVNLYVYDAPNRWSSYKFNTLDNLALGMITNRRDQHYTITFRVTKSESGGLKLYDRVKDIETEITDGGKYEFDVDASTNPDIVAGTNYTINNRFFINYIPETPAGEFEICHIGNELTIANNPYPGNIVIKNAAGQTKINVEPAPSIDLSGLEAGRYTVEIGDKHLVIIIK